MKKLFFAAILLPLACSVSFGQVEVHSDVEFGYDDFSNPSTIIVESTELTDDGIPIIEADFDSFAGQVFSDSPGFITIATEEGPGGERVNPGDVVSIRFLDASQNSAAGVGFVNFYDAATDQLESTGQISATPQNGSSSVLNGGTVANGIDTVLLSIGSNGTTQSNSPDGPPEVLGAGEIHNHLVFTLAQDTPGAYGLLIELEAVPAGGGTPVNSAPVWLIFNNGLDEDVFENFAVPAFSAAAPLLGDVNGDGAVDFLDISPFILLLSTGTFQEEADINADGAVDFLDIASFITLLSGQ